MHNTAACIQLNVLQGVDIAHSQEVPLLDMRDVFGDVSSKAHTDSDTNHPHFLTVNNVHHRMRHDNQFTNLELV